MRIQMEANEKEIYVEPPLLPAGDYVGEVTEVRDGITFETKRPKVDLTFAVMSQDGRLLGKVFHTVVVIPRGEKGHGMMLALNKALGLPYRGDVSFDTTDYLRRYCPIRLSVVEFEGKRRNKITRFISGEDPVDAAIRNDGPVPQPAPSPTNSSQKSPLGF